MGTESVSDSANEIDEDIFAEQVVAKLRASPVLMSQDDAFEFDGKVRADEDGATRRMALVTLTKPGVEFLDAMSDNDFAVGCANLERCITGYVGRLKQLIELMEVAQARLMVGLATRDDMDGILAMAEKQGVAHG